MSVSFQEANLWNKTLITCKITFGEMHQGRSGTRRHLVYCADHKCSHSIAMDADRWPDNVRLSDIEPRFVGRACGKRGAEVRPHFYPARMGTSYEISNPDTV